jgi:hypothetical protein
MELETVMANVDPSGALATGIAQLTAAAAQLERTAAAIEARFAADSASPGGEVPKVVATVDSDPSVRLAELEMKLQGAEARIAELRAQTGGRVAAGRKTLPLAAAHLLAKHGIDTLDQVNGGALDAALNGLSLEQRIAVKSQLMRAGLLG